MGKQVYVFGPFRLDPLARELLRDGELITLPASAFDALVYLVEHRERPVGKDELIAAVWGRTEVSDNLLAQHIVRLRRVLGEENACIRTVPRIGYHWVADTAIDMPQTEQRGAEAAPTQTVAPAAAKSSAIAATRHGLRRRWIVMLAVVLGATLLGGGWWWHAHSSAQHAYRAEPGALVVVLPAKVEAKGEWGWLRYGLMDIVANHLKASGIRTVPSEAVVAMFRGGDLGDGQDEVARRFDAAWQVQPSATFADGNWRIRLDLRSATGPSGSLDAASGDVLAAAKKASDALLLRLGGKMPGEGEGVTQLDDWLAKVAAARLDNQFDAAQKAIDGVPAAWRDDPKVEYARAMLDCDRGQRDACEKRLLGLLDRLPADKQPQLRGQAMYTLAMRHASSGQLVKATKMMDEAIGLLETAKAGDLLANAYLNRAWLAQSQDQVDVAVTFLGKGRAAYTLSGNIYGTARADFEMGLIAARRGQLDSAMVFLQRSYDQFSRYGARTMLPSLLDGMASVAKLQLKYRDELAFTDRFWPIGPDIADVHMRRELTFVRAIALADNGRVMEASSLAGQLQRELDPKEDEVLASEVPELLAELAYGGRHYAEAVRLARQALQGGDLDHPDRAATWLLLSRALRHSGQPEQALAEIGQFKAWAGKLARNDDWFLVYADLADAESIAATDRARGLERLAALMPRAQKAGVPELIVSVGYAYANTLIQAGQVTQAMAVSGALSAWAQDDLRVVVLEARIYDALGHAEARDEAMQRARALAGERELPAW
ncbi:transcriptional regulator [Dyella sp. BiH032]|uniref:transcriptional regulator n=1 Tax=Dyella sp. BiH032 TaxID=3075430 RepID=UPI002892DA36|nr:transcriptional regulator [Dyella sp. BiH032]WNL44352.1 transcriptional regulator [Dyella sp. BiH032]